MLGIRRFFMEIRAMTLALDRLNASISTLGASVDELIAVKSGSGAPPVDDSPLIAAAADTVDALNQRVQDVLNQPPVPTADAPSDGNQLA